MSAARQLGWEQAGITAEHRMMALRIARAFAKRVPPNVRLPDLEAAAITGLWDGLTKSSRFPQVDARQLDYYLKCRVRGAVLDELRSQDWLPRRTRRAQVLAPEGEPAAEPPIVVLYGADTNEFGGERRPWFEALADRGENAEERCVRASELARVQRAITGLPWRMQRILRLHYQRGVKFLHIARELGVSEPRISQLHQRAIERLRESLREQEDHEHRGVDRGAGDAPEEDPGTGTFHRGVPGRGLGGSPPEAADRPVPGGAGGAELFGAPRPRARGARAALRAPGAAPDRGDGGVTVSMPEPELAPAPEPTEPPVPSVLPVDGIQQAMLQAGGNQQDAARLLGLAPSSLNHALRVGHRRRMGARARMAPQPVAPPELVPPEPPRPAPEPPSAPAPRQTPAPLPARGLADRIDWARVAELRARGLSTVRVAQKISFSLGAHWVLVEKALKQGRAPAAAE